MNQSLNNETSIQDQSPAIVVVIGRQFGSGGRRIGRKVADLLGIEYYDTELISEAAERLGYAKEIFVAHDEKKPNALWALLQGAYGIADNFHDVGICGERMYTEQSRAIRDICSRKSCVVVGRTADFILRDNPRLISVFLHSPLDNRALSIVKRGEAESVAEAMEMARKKDKERESYYNYYTGGNDWGKAANYDLTVDSSNLTEDEVANLIVSYTKKKIEKIGK